jgi:DNA-binding HxlR family transcriptional regulator
MSLRSNMDTNEGKCGVLGSIEVWGGRYKLLIIRLLLFEKRPLRFGELRRDLPGVSQKTVTRNLRDLADSGLLTRKVYAEVPPRVEYELTEAGRALMPVFVSMRRWAEIHLAS